MEIFVKKFDHLTARLTFASFLRVSESDGFAALSSDEIPQTVVDLASPMLDDTASARLSPKRGIGAGRGTRLAPMRLRRRADGFLLTLSKNIVAL